MRVVGFSALFMCDEHMLVHGVPVFLEKDGVLVPAPRCPISPCPAAGLAFAAFELRWYRINACDQEQAALFETAAAHLPHGQQVEELLEEAKRRREALFSRPLQVPVLRRPRAALAQAVAQHLRSGGFSYPAIGKLIGSTFGCAEKRCAEPDIRSVMPYGESDHRGA